MIDLTITPQASTLTPAAHLTEDQAEHVIRDWHDYADTTRTTSGTWTVALVHTIGGAPCVTAVAHIPRSVANPPAADRSTRLTVIDGGGHTPAPQATIPTPQLYAA